jgi:type II secretory pathway pseudopilin PulG
MRYETGQSLIELLIAMSIFALAVSAITFLILDVYLADRVGRERMIATFLAKEGMEASRSIRDNNWEDLTNGEYGLAMSGGNWVFQGNQEDVSGRLKEGVRKIIVEEIDSNRKKITSQVIWKLTEARSQDVSLITYLTNWRAIAVIESCNIACQWEDYSEGKCKLPRVCPDENELGGLGEYDCSANKVCCCQ